MAEKLTVYQRTALKFRADALAYEILGDKEKAKSLREHAKLSDNLHEIYKEHFRNPDNN